MIEALKPALDAVSTLDAKLRQKPVYEEELASLEGNLKKKAEEEKAISGSLTNLAFNEDTFKACEQENAELQNVQRRILSSAQRSGRPLHPGSTLLISRPRSREGRQSSQDSDGRSKQPPSIPLR